MISIIISTYNSDNYKKIANNIKQTIGLDFEIIPIENDNIYSMAEAYNMGAEKAKYQYLCFVHEDVIFQTNNWGCILIKNMEENKKIGLIGVVGTKRITRYSLGWYSSILSDKLLCGHLNQGLNSWKNYNYEKFSLNKKRLDYVISLDGFFLFTKKEIWVNNLFDEKIIKGFHGYDLDYCLQLANNGWKSVVNTDILLYHYSLGKINKNWLKTNILILKKFKKILPYKTEDLKINKSILIIVDIIIFIKYYIYMFKYLIGYKK